MTDQQQLIDDLVTLIDACDLLASSIGGDWNDPRDQLRAIYDAHDIAHVLTGGDRTRESWRDIKLMFPPWSDGWEYAPEVYPDVRDRLLGVIERAEEAS